MKYIRTKDGRIIECSNTCNIRDYYQYVGGIKVADTIEELCDEFIAVDKKEPRNTQFISLKEFWLRSLGMNLDYIYYYGAIWTDKGLIYVAKMNDKGELELL